MSRIQVTRQHVVCAICGKNHYTGCFQCEFYGIPTRHMYKSRCSRCNQPGHNRSNRQKCSLYNQYPNYNYLENNYSLNGPSSGIVTVLPPPPPQQQPHSQQLQPQPVVVSNMDVLRQDMLNTIKSLKTIFVQILSNKSTRAKLIDKCLHFKSRILIIEENISKLNENELKHKTRYINEVTRYLLYIITLPKRELPLTKIVNDCYEPPSECCICIIDNDYNAFCELNCKHKVCVSCMCSLIKRNKHSAETPITCPLCRCDISNLTCYKDEDIVKIDYSL